MLRLTLRTLLAWLDDTLSPSEVREIGKQVAESPVGKELVERIQRVTRQRRLTVPGTSGADATDPNLVAAYLDGALDPDIVADFEKKCLTSDVHLAEVASVHQILSLIGQKAKVPVEARHRMYHLVKGREAIAPKIRRSARASAVPSPVSEPVNPWVVPPPPARPLYQRFGPLAIVVLLMAVLCWTAWKSLTPPTPAPSDVVAQNVPAPGVEGAPVPKPAASAKKEAETSPPSQNAPENAVQEDSEAKMEREGSSAPSEAEKKDLAAATSKNREKAGKESSTVAEVPAGSVGVVRSSDVVLMRYVGANVDTGPWERLAAKTPLKDQDRLLNLAPFRTKLELGSAQVELVGETELWVRTGNPMLAARLALTQGRIVLHGTSPPSPFQVQFAGRELTLNVPSGGSVGLERLNRREPGSTEALPPVLRIFAADGTVTALSDDVKETLKGPGAVTFGAAKEDGPREFRDRSSDLPPSWVTETLSPPFEVHIGEQFATYFPPGRPIIAAIVEAIDSDQKEIRQLAISALRATGDILDVVPLLNREDPVQRRTALRVLRAYLAEGPEATRALHRELESFFGKDQGEKIEKLLVGYTDKEAKDPKTYEGLVKLLESTDEGAIGVRELALDNLETLTGRDDLGYDPAKPEGKGLRAWQDLQKNKELRQLSAPKAKK